LFLALLAGLPAAAAQKAFDFGLLKEGDTPPGFRSVLSGAGKPGEWKIVMDETPSAMPPLNPGAPSVSRRPVLAQVSTDRQDERFPMLIYEPETFGDFSLTTKFKTVEGKVERMAGLAFRIQNETNYYVLRASSLGNTFRFYKVVNGQRGAIIGPEIPIPSGTWHEMTVECKGNKIRCFLNGQSVIPELTDNSFQAGRIGFWTKSDSVTYFTDCRVTYTPRADPALAMVRDVLKRYPRLLDLQMFALRPGGTNSVMIAARDEASLGRPGGKVEADVLAAGTTYYGKEKDSVSVVRPVRDRNGDIVAVVRVLMKSFPGQTEQNAVVRAAPIVKELQEKVLDREDLVN
jgi:hypothetical protein